jgi:epoxyqueuosine reductase
MGNAIADDAVPEVDKDLLRTALSNALPMADDLVGEHIEWALGS